MEFSKLKERHFALVLETEFSAAQEGRCSKGGNFKVEGISKWGASPPLDPKNPATKK